VGIYFILFGLLLVGADAKAVVVFKCPYEVSTTQSLKGAVPSEWEPLLDTLNGNQLIERISVYDGHPKEGADLIPDNVGKNGGKKEDSYWSFTPGRTYWLACFYSQNVIRLVQKIPSDVKKCTLKIHPAYQRPVSLTCG